MRSIISCGKSMIYVNKNIKTRIETSRFTKTLTINYIPNKHFPFKQTMCFSVSNESLVVEKRPLPQRPTNDVL